MSDPVYADAIDYRHLKAKLYEAEVLLKTVLRDDEMNVQSVTGQLIHSWLVERESAQTVK